MTTIDSATSFFFAGLLLIDSSQVLQRAYGLLERLLHRVKLVFG
jgi:hypothetical protein